MSKELKTGVIAIFIIVLGIWGYNFLKGQDVFSGAARSFKVEYKNVNGLTKNSQVTINGLVVGKVKDIVFNQEASQKGTLIVHFYVNNDFEFSKKSIVKIYSPSPLGGANLAIHPVFEGELAKSGDFLKGEVQEGMFASIGKTLGPIEVKFNSMLVSMDSLLVGVNQILDYKARKSMNRSIISLENTVLGVRKTLYSVNSLLKDNKTNLNETLTNTKKITDNFAKISDDMVKANLGGTTKKLEQTLLNVNQLLASVKNGKGTLGKLMTDDKMYKNLTNASKEMEELLREMKLNPKRFVHFSLFGKKPKPYNKKNNNNNVSNK